MVNYLSASGLAIATIFCSTVNGLAIRQEVPPAASVQCYPTTDCSGPPAGLYSYNSNSDPEGNCYDASNCECMVVTELQNANVQYWTGGAGADCTGESSTYNLLCGDVIPSSSQPNYTMSTTGTNSLSVNVGCAARKA